MERVFKIISGVKAKLQQSFVEISSQVKSFVRILNLEDESTDSRKALYLLSLLLLIFLIFLSPDKISQTFTSMQLDAEIFEKIQEITKIIKKLMPHMG